MVNPINNTYLPISQQDQEHIDAMSALVEKFLEPDLTDDERRAIQKDLTGIGKIYREGVEITNLGLMTRR